MDNVVSDQMLFNPMTWFSTVTSFILATILLTQIVKNYIKQLRPRKRFDGRTGLLISWGIACIMSLIGNYWQLGIFAEYNWWQALLFSVLATGISNIAFKSNATKTILTNIKLYKK